MDDDPKQQPEGQDENGSAPMDENNSEQPATTEPVEDNSETSQPEGAETPAEVPQNEA